LRTVLHINNNEDDDDDNDNDNDNDNDPNLKRKTSDSSDLDPQNKKKKAVNLKDKTVKKNVPRVRKCGKKSKSDESDEVCSMKDKCLRPNGKQLFELFFS
jgi:hypothetical protein